MNNSLDLPLHEFEQLLAQTSAYVMQKFNTMNEDKAFSGLTPSQIQAWMDEPLPAEGMESSELLAFVKEKVVDTATMNMAPNMYAYVMAGGTQISILAELLATTINQNVGKWHLAPVMSEMERQVAQWGAAFIGYDPQAAGVLVSGGSAANLTALTVARNVYFERENIRETGLFNAKPFTVYASTETHSCVDKSVDLLGIGFSHYRKIPVLSDYTIDISALESAIQKDIENGFRPFCLVGNAGTVNTGAIDPLARLSTIAKKYNLWFHVDGAYGALAAAVPEINSLYEGIAEADSVALDFHKWLYQSFEAGCTLVKNWEQLKKTYFKQASYLASDAIPDGRLDFNEHQFQLSRNAKALKIWMSFKAYGSDRITQMIRKDLELTKYLAKEVDESSDFVRCSDHLLGIVCFQFKGDLAGEDQSLIEELNRAIIPALEKDGRVFITGTRLGEKPVIRACLINHRLQVKNIDFLLQVIREVGQSTLSNMQSDAYSISKP